MTTGELRRRCSIATTPVGAALFVSLSLASLAIAAATAQLPTANAQLATPNARRPSGSQPSGVEDSQQQPRDLPRTAAGGTASLSGTVLTDDNESRPLRRVRVFLDSPDSDVARTTIADDSGAFVFAELPAGRYTVGGTKEGYVTVSYGARRPGSPGAPIILRDKQTIADLTLKLPRGAVITGTLFDPGGQPLPGVSMRALRFTYASGERRLTPVYTGMPSHVTDDRGVYRIYGLAAGDYAIAAPARLSGSGNRDVLMMTDAAIRRGLDELKQTGRPSMSTSDETSAASVADTDAPRVGYAPVFYPGTTAPSQAAMIKVAQGEERREVDFQMQYVPVSAIRGTVLGGDRVYSGSTTVHLIANGPAVLAGTGHDGRTAAVARDGTFAFSNVAPGPYTLIARATRAPGLGEAAWWASTEVIADGQSEQELTLALQPALTLSGRVAFEGTGTLPEPTRVRVTLEPVLAGAQVSLATTPVHVSAAGRFAIAGITAARYRLRASVSGHPDWMLKSSSVDGRDALDVPVDLRSSIDGAVLTFTNRVSDISGTVRDGSGRAMSGYAVVLFPSEQALWLPGARRIRSILSANDGTFRFRNLPAGEYLLGVVADAEDGEWFDREFLDPLASSSVKVTLAEGERKSQDVVAARQDGSGRLVLTADAKTR